MKIYECAFEIAGPTAMFTRPDTGAAPVSYPAPTYSAAKAMFEAILRLKFAEVRPVKVEICAPIVYHDYTTNYGGPWRKSKLVQRGNSYQLLATVLINVCYRLHAVVEEVPGGSNANNRHSYQEQFLRRLDRGQCCYIPCLGWKEFVPSYVGRMRERVKVQEDINLAIPAMLHAVWDKPSNGKPAPVFRQNVRIRNGCLVYAQ